MSRALKDVKNFFLGGAMQVATVATTPQATEQQKLLKKNVGRYISQIQFARIRNDIQSWRAAIVEAELAWWPHRVRMQRIFQDTILNEHIEACIRKRNRLTLSRGFRFVSADNPDDITQDDPVLKKLFNQAWFDNFQTYALEAKYFGYSLISLGDVENDRFTELTIIPRQNVSPDRLNVTSIVNQVNGLKFTEPPYDLYHVWVPTPSDLGVSKCGYGLLYKLAKTEIYLRNATESNVDGIEVFGQPIRKGKTTKTDPFERDQFEAALRDMGSMPYILLDDGQDELELVESKQVGTGYQIYGDFEKRQEQKISKVLLGHADAMESTPGKLGSEQGGGESPAQIALNEVQVEDGGFLENIINNQLLPRMRQMGFKIPITKEFRYSNDKEKEQTRRKEDDNNMITAQVAETMKSAGLVMDAKYFEERTGIITTVAPEPVPIVPGAAGVPGKPGAKPPAKPGKPGEKPQKGEGLNEKTKSRLKKIYSKPNEEE
jgi:hypothetical protein